MIFIISGKAKTGKTEMANALRDRAISNKRGGLIVDEQTEGEDQHLLEKIIAGDALVPGTKADDVNWKPDSSIIVVGKHGLAKLAAFEEMVPGLKKKLGPVILVDLTKG